MPNTRNLHVAVSRRADTAKSQITVAVTSRVIAALCDEIAEHPESFLDLNAGIALAKVRLDKATKRDAQQAEELRAGL